MLDWLCAGRSDYRGHQRRRQTYEHRRRRAWCVWVWIAAATLIGLHPTLQVAIVSSLLATFLTFTILEGGSSR